MGFQNDINRDIPRGVSGDFASTNPRTVMIAGEGALVAAEDITVGYFAFADLDTGKVYKANDTGRVIGFVHRNNQAAVPLGSAANMVIRAGKEIALFTVGDFYTVLDDDSNVGDAVTAVSTTGKPSLTAVASGFLATNFKAAEAKLSGELVKITVNGV